MRTIGTRSLLSLCVFGASLLASMPAHAIGYAESDDVSVDATGYLRLTQALLHYPDLPAPLPSGEDGLIAAVGRLILKGTLTEELSYESNFFLQLTRSPGATAGGSLATAGSFITPYRTQHLSWQLFDESAGGTTSYGGQLGIDRLRLQIDADPLTLTLGRFPINYGVTNVMSPNDFFAPFGATAINTAFKPGVDALRLAWAVDELSSVELVGVLGYEQDDVPSSRQSAMIARASTVLWGLEGAIIGGKLAQRWVVGASLQGDLGPLMLRSEGHASFADHDADGGLDGDIENVPPALLQRDEVAARLAVGLDKSFEWQSLTIGAEYAFFSDGASSGTELPARALSRFPDDLPFGGQHYVSAVVSGEIIPILRSAVTSLVNLGDGSGLVSASLLYDAADEISMAGGVIVPWGRRPDASVNPGTLNLQSELGNWPLVAFAESRIYF